MMKKTDLIKLSDSLRENRTASEKHLSKILTGAGIQFKEQVAAGYYILDFYFPAYSHKVIELDGKQFHDKERDARRDRWLWINGFAVRRIASHKVFHNDILERVKEWLDTPTKQSRNAKPLRKKALRTANPPRWRQLPKLTRDHRVIGEKSLWAPPPKPKKKKNVEVKVRPIKVIKKK